MIVEISRQSVLVRIQLPSLQGPFGVFAFCCEVTRTGFSAPGDSYAQTAFAGGAQSTLLPQATWPK
jgi:hypothetical protein